MRVIEPVEILYLTRMQRWQRTAPPDQHQGELDGIPTRNSQTERLIYVLRDIAVGPRANNTYSILARYSRRNDGNSYISQNTSWMIQPVELSNGWYFEGCTSLVQKQSILHHLGKLGLSSIFSQAVEDFVANKSIEGYLPTEADEPAIRARIQAWEEKNEQPHQPEP